MPRDHKDTIEHPVPRRTAQRRVGEINISDEEFAAELGIAPRQLLALEEDCDRNPDVDRETFGPRWDRALARILEARRKNER